MLGDTSSISPKEGFGRMLKTTWNGVGSHFVRFSFVRFSLSKAHLLGIAEDAALQHTPLLLPRAIGALLVHEACVLLSPLQLCLLL